MTEKETRVHGGNPGVRGEHANTAQAGQRWELNTQCWKCEANIAYH